MLVCLSLCDKQLRLSRMFTGQLYLELGQYCLETLSEKYLIIKISQEHVCGCIKRRKEVEVRVKANVT